MTLGQEFSGWASQVEMSIRLLRLNLEPVHELAIGGTAVGTGLNAPAGFGDGVCRELKEMTGKDFRPASNLFAALAGHEPLSAFGGALASTACAFHKIANDVRLLASGPRCGLGELSLPENEPGSSIMPGKVNPTQAEALTMVAGQVLACAQAVNFGAANGHFQLNVYKPLIIHNVLQAVGLLADGSRSFADHCAAGIVANEAVLKHHLENTLMLVTALNTHIGYDKAAKIARLAHEQGISLKAAASSSGILTEQEYDTLVRPQDMTGPLATGR